jgi:hypothetical protein
MNLLEALFESERLLDETAERHACAQVRVNETTVALQKALLAHSAAHNAYQISLRNNQE